MKYLCLTLPPDIAQPRAPVRLLAICIRRAASLAMALCFCCGLTPDAAARDLKIATIAVAPFGMQGADGTKSGNAFEIGNLIAEEIGLPYYNVVVPYPRALAMIESGDADLLIAFPSERLSEVAKGIARVSTLDNIVIGRRGTRFRTLEDLHGKIVGAVREAKYDAQFTADSAIRKYSTNNYEQGVNMLLAERLDAVVGVKEGIYFALQSVGGTRSMLGEPLVLSRQDVWLHFSNKAYDEQTAAALKSAVLRLQRRGAIQKIDDKYLGQFNKN